MNSHSNAMDVDGSIAPTQPPTIAHPTPTNLPQTDHIVLDVDGRKFRTRKSVISHCEYFATLFSGRWAVELLPDGSLPIDADPEIFPTLFAYLKRPAVYPLLWTREKSFDYAAYNKLMAEADFLGLDDLQDWIRQKKYLEVVKTSLKLEIHPGLLNPVDRSSQNHKWLRAAAPRPPLPSLPEDHDLWDRVHRNIPPQADLSASEDIQLVSCIQAMIPSQGSFKCVDNIPSHLYPDLCEREGCHPYAVEDEEYWKHVKYEEIPTSIVTVTKYTEHRPERCLKGYAEPGKGEETDKVGEMNT